MLFRFHLFFLIFVCLGWNFTAHAATARLVINVVTSDQFPIDSSGEYKNFAIQVFNLDAVHDIELSLGTGLPKSEGMARLVVEDRIRQVGQENFNHQLITAYQPLMMVMRFGLDRIPAMIIDERVVVYGVTDIAFAIEQYKAWLKMAGADDE